MGGTYPGAIHGSFELFAILRLIDGFHAGANQLHSVICQHTATGQFHGQIQCGLATHGRQYGVRLFTADNGLKIFCCKWLKVGRVGQIGIGHDSSRVGVNQNHPVTFFL